MRNVLRRTGDRLSPRVYRVTTARRGASEDIRRRERRYVVTMLVRTVCLVLAVVVPVTPLRVAFVLGAVLLPYFAVVFANSGHERDDAGPEVVGPPPPIPLPSGADATDSTPGTAPPRHGSVS